MDMKVDIVHGDRLVAGAPLVLCTFRFDGQRVTCSNETFLKLAGSMGAIGADGRTYYPRDGMAFMRALPILYRGPHLRALDPVQGTE